MSQSIEDSNSIAWVLFVLVVLHFTFRFIDFMLGPLIQRKLKDQITEYYVSINYLMVGKALQLVMGAFVEYLNYVFGRKIISIRSIALCTFISILISISYLMLFLYSQGYIIEIPAASEGHGKEVLISFSLSLITWDLFFLIMLYLVVLAVFDNLSIILTRLIIGSGRITNVLIKLIADAIVAIILFCLGIVYAYATFNNLTTHIIEGNQFSMGAVERFIEFLGDFNLAKFYLELYLENPNYLFFATPYMQVAMFPLYAAMITATTLFPTIVYLLSAGIMGVLAGVLKIFRAPISLILQRLEGSDSGIFTNISYALSAISGSIIAFQKI